eukprot:3686653-Rhodomonas_salina.1
MHDFSSSLARCAIPQKRGTAVGCGGICDAWSVVLSSGERGVGTEVGCEMCGSEAGRCGSRRS